MAVEGELHCLIYTTAPLTWPSSRRTNSNQFHRFLHTLIQVVSLVNWEASSYRRHEFLYAHVEEFHGPANCSGILSGSLL
jgi:hypothetical protein